MRHRRAFPPIPSGPDRSLTVRWHLSHTLGLMTVAEGVETSATAAVLTSYGCDIAQGHYFSHPITAAELLHLITQHTHTIDRQSRK
jgi:EAL domain-containing protein (putative c-di-GMP-specific phosphodiesterase class I)